MNKLSSLETALLKEFENLVREFEALASASQTTDQQLTALSGHFSQEISALARRQNALEERLNTVTEALNRQTEATDAHTTSVEQLINSVQRLMTAQR